MTQLSDDGVEAAAGGEPLFEQLRSVYLHRDDPNDWTRDGDTGGWVDDSGSWAAAGAVGVEDEDRYRWVDAPAWEADAEAGWDDADAYGDLDEDEGLDEDEDDLDLGPPAPRARGGRRRTVAGCSLCGNSSDVGRIPTIFGRTST